MSEALRTRLFLRSVLPLLRVVLEDDEAAARPFAGLSFRAQIETQDGHGACLCFENGELSVEPAPREAAEVAVRFIFKDRRTLNSFFAGKPIRPRVKGLRHPRLLWKTVRLLSSLRILHPQGRPKNPAARALRVKLLLYLVTQAIEQLHRGGHATMNELVSTSPDRVYQWTVTSERIGAYLRIKHGRVQAGFGTCRARRPFVHFVFPDVEAALAVLTATDSQMSGVREGRVQTFGSPEYTRKISLLMQKVDALLTEGQ